MTTDPTIALRPRTAGEILDDAWRLTLAEAPLLLALSGLFAVPALTALLLLLTRPAPASVAAQMVLPALVALLLPLTGLGSAACQELFRRRAAGERVTLTLCLWAALRRGPQHAAARALMLLAVGLASVFLLLPGLAIWVSFGTLHAILTTGDGRLFTALRDAARNAQRQPISSGAVVLSRLPLLLFAALNLFLLIEVGLWAAGNLAGLEVAFVDVLVSPINPAFVLPLFAISWLLLTPYFEASSFLLHLDNRVRYEGLDLAYRIRALFPAVNKGKVAALLLALGGALLVAGPAQAEDARLKVVREVRQGVRQLIDEVASTKTFPDGDRYHNELRELIRRLPFDPRRGHWFDDAVREFGWHEDREGALRVLDRIEERLAEMEDALAPPEGDGSRLPRSQIKKDLPPADGNNPTKSRSRKQEEEKEKEKVRKDDPRQDRADDNPGGSGGGGASAPSAGGAGLGSGFWMVLAGLGVVALAVVLILFFRNRDAPPAPAVATAPAVPEALSLEPDEQSPNDLWRRAESLAEKGEFLEAVRFLYLAMLTLLHRADQIRYEKTRTNGEYLRQLREAEAGSAVIDPFRRLTRLFEQKWYGERSCAAGDYESCRELAEALRGSV